MGLSSHLMKVSLARIPVNMVRQLNSCRVRTTESDSTDAVRLLGITVSLRLRKEDGKTMCDMRDNKKLFKQFPSNYTFPFDSSFSKDQITVMF